MLIISVAVLTEGLFCVLLCAKCFVGSSLVFFTMTLWNMETQAEVSKPVSREAGTSTLVSSSGIHLEVQG